jgi:hypothetical protein
VGNYNIVEVNIVVAVLTDLTTIVFLYQRKHPEEGRITGRNELLKI